MRRTATVTAVLIALVSAPAATQAATTASSSVARGSVAKPVTSSIRLTKTAAAPVDVDGNGIDSGDTIKYSFALTNTGSRSVSGLQINDPLLGSISCSPTTLAAGASASCSSIIYTITQADMDAGTVGSTATATAVSSTGGTVSSSSSTTTTLAARPALAFSKSAGAVTDVDGNGTDAGDTIRYTFALANSGNVTLSAVGVSDPVLGSVSCSPSTLVPGANASCAAITYTITQADMDAGSVGSTAAATATPPKGSAITATSATTTPLTTTAALSVTVTPQTYVDADADGLLDVGDSQPYQYRVTNTGSASLSGIAVQSSLGDTASCASGTVAPGATATCTSSHVVTLAEVGAGTLTNTATATSGSVTSPAASAQLTFDRMNIALQKGLPNLVSYQELVTKAKALSAAHTSLAATLVPGTAMNWEFDKNGKAATALATPYQQVILRSNHNYYGGSSIANLAVAGTAPGQSTRMAYTASDPFANRMVNPETPMADAGMNEFDVNLLSWLLKTSNLSASTAQVRLVNTYGSTTTRVEAATRQWLASKAPSLQLNATECNLPADSSCLAGANLIVFGGTGSDTDGPTIANQLKAAYDAGVPVLFMGDYWSSNAGDYVAQKFGMTVSYSPTYWDYDGLLSSTSADQLPGGLDAFQQVVNPLVNTTFGTPLATGDYSACIGHADVLVTCSLGTAAFNTYRAAVSAWQGMVSAADQSGTSWFTQPRTSDQDLMRALVMLADKLRTGVAPSLRSGDAVPAVTYPVPTTTDAAATTRALFVDGTTMTAWTGNQAAADTGTVYCSRANTVAHTCTAPGWPGFGNHTLTLTSTQNDEWQETGFDAKPGVPVTISLTSNPGVKVYVRTFFQRSGTTKSGLLDGSSRSYFDRPQYLATDWIPVTTTPTTFSSPYGGPLYIRIVGSTATNGTSVPLELDNTATHPTVLDMTDNTQVDNFISTIDDGAYYADLGGTGFEAHMPISAIKAALTSSGTGGRTWDYNSHGGLQQFLDDYRDQYVFTVYKMAGLQLGPNTPLATSDDPDVVKACQDFGLPCLNAALNQRTIIQHVNYDQHANCGDLCSGNPIDSDGNPTPSGWGENHELGHNLQRKQLNVMWADTGANGSNAAAANVWTSYVNRSGEVSNNIFPYHTYWNFYRNVHPGWGITPTPPPGTPDTGYLSRDVGGTDAFSIAQSIRSGQSSGGVLRALDSSCVAHNTTDTTATPVNIAIANAIWRNSGTYDDNNLRMSFYQEIPIMLRGTTLADGTTLHDGYGIWTLLYQAARGWSSATSSQSAWTAAAQATYGMTDFAWTNDAVYGAGQNVGSMIGNDFLLIELSKMTGYDWRPYFQVHGAMYTALADQQVSDNAPAGGYKSFNNTYPALGTQLPFADMSNIGTVDMTSPSAAWPGAYDSSTTTKSKVGFTPTSCP